METLKSPISWASQTDRITRPKNWEASSPRYLNMSPTLYADRLDRLVFAIQKGVARQLTARMS